jgi:hypothetical protein
MKTLGIVLVIAGIIGLLVGGGLYLFMTKTVEITTVPITIEKATYYTGQTSAGFLGPKEAYYSQIQVEPTVTAQPNTDYLITTNNGITAQTYSVSWNQAELAISKLKTITDRISQDAITGLHQKSQYTVNISEKVAQHEVIFIIPGILFFVLGAILWVMSMGKEPVTMEHNQKEQSTKPIFEPNRSLLEKGKNMSEKILGPSELEKIAKEYVQYKENISDVEIIGTKSSLIETLPIHILEGSAKKHSMSSNFHDAIIAECSFRLWISAKDGKVIDYQPGEWVKKNVEQTSTSYSSEYVEYIEPIQPSKISHINNPWQERLDRMADINLKNAQAEKERANAHLIEEKAKNEREKRHKPLW